MSENVQNETTSLPPLIEYNPSPPFASGHPSIADARLVDAVRKAREPLQQKRIEQAKRVAAWYCG
jgi:cyclohexyl-isocyanide hydratase